VRKLQFFISSPGDVCEERALASRVIERLQSEYMGRVALDTILWEHEPLVATSTFQVQLVKPSETDVVISILWSRLGTRLPAQFTRADGSRYESGTEYEFEEAMEGFRRNGKPDLLVYRRTAPPSVRLDDERDLMERLSQKKKLDEFIEKWFHDRTEGTLVAAFHPFASPSDFEILLENHLRRLIERQLPRSAVATAQARDVWKKGSPFRGLAAFELEHAPVFFGRTRAVSDILQALRQQSTDGRSLVLILGMSGGGKSSVVRAGVLPMLTKPGVIEGITFWRRAVFRPTDVRGDIFAGLARALLKDEALPSLDGEGAGADEFAQILRQSPQAATAMVRNALAREAQSDKAGGDKANGRLALVIDQMEEMFTHEGILPEHREAFIDVIDAFARSGRVWVICTLRSDFYPRLAALPKLTALKEGAGQYDLMPPNASEIGQMIRLPTRAAGLRFEEDPTTNESLDDMLRDAALERPEILPLLQFTLEELYQRRTEDGLLTLAAYRELGGVEGSLAQRAEAVFQDLPKDVQAELPKVLNALVSIEQDGHETVGRKRGTGQNAGAEKGGSESEAFHFSDCRWWLRLRALLTLRRTDIYPMRLVSSIPAVDTASRRLFDERSIKLMDRHCFKCCTIGEEIHELSRFHGAVVSEEGGFGFLLQDGNGLGSPSAMADGIFDDDLRGLRPIAEEHLHGIRDGTFFGVEIVAGVLLVFTDHHRCAQGVDPRIRRDPVLVVIGRQFAEYQSDCRHVLQAMIAIRRIVQRAGLVDDPNRGLVRGEFDALDVRQAIAHEGMQLQRTFDRGLRVEFRGKGKFEQDVLHHIAAERACQFHGLAAEGDILEAPGFRAQCRWVAHLARQRDEREPDGAAGGVAGRPGFSRAGVGRVAIGSQRGTVEPRVRERVDDLFARAAEESGCDGSGGNAHK
jgi:hypothetical protein